MTRFQRELSGELGRFWKNEAEKKIEKARTEYQEGTITVDENGVARNRIGRILMDDMAEVLEYAIGSKSFSREATANARKQETAEFLKNYQEPEMTAEEIAEARATFGAGTTIVNVLTGRQMVL